MASALLRELERKNAEADYRRLILDNKGKPRQHISQISHRRRNRRMTVPRPESGLDGWMYGCAKFDEKFKTLLIKYRFSEVLYWASVINLIETNVFISSVFNIKVFESENFVKKGRKRFKMISLN